MIRNVPSMSPCGTVMRAEYVALWNRYVAQYVIPIVEASKPFPSIKFYDQRTTDAFYVDLRVIVCPSSQLGLFSTIFYLQLCSLRYRNDPTERDLRDNVPSH